MPNRFYYSIEILPSVVAHYWELQPDQDPKSYQLTSLFSNFPDTMEEALEQASGLEITKFFRVFLVRHSWAPKGRTKIQELERTGKFPNYKIQIKNQDGVK